ncbi:MAG: hypothetical protein AAFR11_05590 [Pseudomonadota bacterium]
MDDYTRSHNDLIGKFRNSEQSAQHARKLATRDRRYYDNYNDDQWTTHEREELQKRKQQIVTSNHVKRKVDFLKGYEQQTRSDPKALPRRPDMEKGAEVTTQALVYLDDNIQLDQVFSDGFDQIAIEGIEAVECRIEDGEVCVESIDYDSLFWDPRSRKRDFSDARYLGYSQWMDLDTARSLYPDADEAVFTASHSDMGEGHNEAHADRPWNNMYDAQRQRVRVLVFYCKNPSGDWSLHHATTGGVLFEGPSPYLDDKGVPTCGIIAQSLYVNWDNNRFGAVRDMISLQDERNRMRSRQMHLLSDRRSWGVKGFANDENEFKANAARADGHMEVNTARGVGWDFVESSTEFAGLNLMLQTNGAELGEEGPSSGLRGRGVEQQSGRAILAQQQAGITQENLLYDSHNNFKRRVYRRCWELIKQFWTEQRFIRILEGDQQKVEFKEVNVPLTDAYGFPVINPRTGEQAIFNRLADVDVDINIEVVPDTASLQAEEFEKFSNMLPTLIQAPPQWARLAIVLSDMRNKEQALQILDEMMQGATQPSIEDQVRVQEEQRKGFETQVSAAKMQAETVKTQIEAAKLYAEAQNPEPVAQYAAAGPNGR